MSSPPPSKRQKSLIPSGAPKLNAKNQISTHHCSNGMATNGETPELDEGLYSRQLYVMGSEGMRKMATSDVLISGLDGLGLETAKCIVLAGVKSVTLHDPTPISLQDLSTHFFASASDVGKNRAEVSRPKLAELNGYVPVTVLSKPKLTVEDIKHFTVVVISQASHELCMELGDMCRQSNVKFIAASTCGLFGRLFCDFGNEFTVIDPVGEEPPSVLIQQVEKSKQGVVMCLEETRHGFEDGDYVTFSEVKGMTELNGCAPRKVTVLGPDAFTIGDTSELSNYVSGGLCTKVIMPKNISFKPYRESYLQPEFIITDFAKMDHPLQTHLFYLTLDEYKKQHSGAPPASWKHSDAEEFVQMATKVAASLTGTGAAVESVDEKLAIVFASTCAGHCAPMESIIGSVAAQEVLKACSGKFTPIQQWVYFDAVECLPTAFQADNSVVAEGDAGHRGNRYDSQVAIFGQQFQDKLANLKYFLVGAGAIGCELLKNFALMGVGCGVNGKVIVTDMDSIEKSNLNRQFLFRPRDISKMKSVVAAEAARAMNPEFKVVAHENRIGPETEKVYDDNFFESLDGIANALDNVESRTYIDRRCVYYHKSLLESGTMATKANVQVVLPYLTESYSSSHDPPDKSFPMCTVKNFPYQIEHTLQWARELFEGLFAQPSQALAAYMRNPQKFVDSLVAGTGSQPVETLELLKVNLVDKRPSTFEDCVAWARNIWQDLYSNAVVQLLFNFPPNYVTSSGADFWSGTKRCPHPLTFNVSNPTHLDFIVAAANIRAFMFGIPSCSKTSRVTEILDKVTVPSFTPRDGVRIEVTEADAQARVNTTMDATRVEELRKALPKNDKGSQFKAGAVDFEKDDDTNFHMDFITAASNLRAANYDIEPADRLKSKLIAGKIIPAIATTTSLVSGLVCLELYKLTQGHKSLEMYKNGFVNLALPFFAFSEPLPPAKSKYYDTEFSIWDRFEVEGEMSLQQFLDHFKNNYKLEITMLTQGVAVLYSFFMLPEKRKSRLSMPMTQLVETVSKRPIPAHVRALVFEVCCSDTQGQDVEVPYVRYLLKR